MSASPGAGAVDVLVPCYNYGRFLEACVGSVFAGAVRPVRVLIIDDCSTDDTEQIGTRLAAANPNVRYVRHRVNRGHLATYNEGIAEATHPYFILLSADDLLAPGSLERAARVLDRYPDVGFVYGRTRKFFVDEPPRTDATLDCEATLTGGRDWIATTFASGINPIHSPASVMVRTGLQQEVGGYLPELPHAGDLEMYLRYATRADVAFLDIDQGLYRKHSAAMSLDFQDLRDYRQRLEAFEAICRCQSAYIRDGDGLLRRARQAMATELFWSTRLAVERGVAPGGTAVDDALAYAARLDPSIRYTRGWLAFRARRMVDASLARVLPTRQRYQGAR